jgi:hypothetical protein
MCSWRSVGRPEFRTWPRRPAAEQLLRSLKERTTPVHIIEAWSGLLQSRSTALAGRCKPFPLRSAETNNDAIHCRGKTAHILISFLAVALWTTRRAESHDHHPAEASSG